LIWLDHVVRIVTDFAATERAFRDEYGLNAARWEVFPDSGVASRLFVLENGGIELMGVRDATKAAEHPFGRLVRAAVDEGERWLATAIGTDELDAHAGRLGLAPMAVSSVSSEGVRSTFRLLGDPLSNPPPLPFFIEWGRGTESPWPRQQAALNPSVTGIKRVEAAGDAVAVAEHLGAHLDSIVVVDGLPAIRAVILDAGGTEIRVE
jgi:glyoxalase-like protein